MTVSLTSGKVGFTKRIRDPWVLFPLGVIVLGLGALIAYWLWPQGIAPRFTMADVDALVERARSDDEKTAWQAVTDLGRIDPIQFHEELGTFKRPLPPKRLDRDAPAPDPPAPGDLPEPSPAAQAVREQLERSLGDSRPAIRAAAARAIGRLELWDSMPALVAALEDGDRRVRGAANGGIIGVLGVDYGFKPNADRAQRRKAVEKIKAEYKFAYGLHLVWMKRRRQRARQEN